MTLRGLLFLTVPAAQGRPVLADVRARHPGIELTVIVRDLDREALAADLGGCTVLSDKPRGGRIAFLRRLRQSRYDRAWVVWQGHGSYDPPKVAALLCRARRLEVYDTEGVPRRLPAALLRRLAGRAPRPDGADEGSLLSGLACTLYRGTLGLLLGVPLVLTRYLLLRTRSTS